jgi:uncharacterized protein (TIGR03435 family)
MESTVKLTALVTVTLVAIGAWADAPILAGQSAQPLTAGAESSDDLTFSSVSLKRNLTNPGPSHSNLLPNGGVDVLNQSVFDLIKMAYRDASVERGTLPSWVMTERYDLVATSPVTGAATFQQQQAMLRALLRERFNLRAHVRVHLEPAYDAVLARPDGQLGPGLSPSPVDCAAREKAIGSADTHAIAERPRNAPPEGPPEDCTSRTVNGVTEGDVRWPTPLMILTAFGVDGRRVVDKTGLKGYYRIHLVQPTRTGRGGDTAGTAGQTPDVFEQLGLTLEESEAPVLTLIVDRVERPRTD